MALFADAGVPIIVFLGPRRILLASALVALAALPALALAAPAGLAGACEEWVPVAALSPSERAVTLGGPCAGIRPGAQMTSPAGCTFNFVFADAASRLYIGTAGHCVNGVGDRVEGAGLGAFGTVVFQLNDGVGNDFALIAIDAAKYGSVTPAMCHWGGPTSGEPAAPALGDALKQYGHGIALGQLQETRPREGTLTLWRENSWRALAPITNGDSGSPLLFATGEAAGVVTHLSTEFSSGEPLTVLANASGTRFARAVALAEAGTGLDLTLLTAPLA